MPTQGPLPCGTGADDATVGTIAWTNPGNVTVSDNNYATAVLNALNVSHYLKATNFGFSIPAGATINAITVEWEIKQTAIDGDLKDNASRIIKGGTIGSTDKSNAASWPTSDAFRSYGSDLWGDTWTSTDINASTFGAALSAQEFLSGSCTASIDHCRITVTYTDAVTGVPTQQVRVARMIGWY
jgi:hypothetical protein